MLITKQMGYNLFISHKACSLVLVVFVCSKAAVKSPNKVVCGYGDIIIITL